MARRERNWDRKRTFIQAAWMALTNGYLVGFLKGKIYTGKTKALCLPGLNCYSCPGALGSCPIGSLQAVFGSRDFKFSFYVFGFLLFFGSLLGRFVCGWLCPFGLVQDLLHKIPWGQKRKNLPGHRYLIRLKYVIFVVFVCLLPALVVNVAGLGSPWFCEYICPSGMLFGGIPLVSLNPHFWETLGFRFGLKIVILATVIIMSVKVYRPFCKYLCPLGAFYGLFNQIAVYQMQVSKDACVHCKKCQKTCKMDICTWKEPNSKECIRCLDCLKACPVKAIRVTGPVPGKNLGRKEKGNGKGSETLV